MHFLQIDKTVLLTKFGFNLDLKYVTKHEFYAFKGE